MYLCKEETNDWMIKWLAESSGSQLWEKMNDDDDDDDAVMNS